MATESGKSVYSKGQFSSLVVKIKKAAELAHIDVEELKELLYFCDTSEIQKAEDLSDVFNIVHDKLCSPDNIEILKVIVDHFNLSNAAVHEYEKILHSEVHKPASNITDTPGIDLHKKVGEDENIEDLNDAGREDVRALEEESEEYTPQLEPITTNHEMESLPLSEQKQEIDKLKKQAMETRDYRALGNKISTILMDEVSYVDRMYGTGTINVSGVESQWKTCKKVVKNVDMFKKKMPNTGTCCFMGRGIIDAPINKVVEYIKNFHRRIEYDEHLTKLKICKEYSEHDWLLYMAHRATPIPIRRDFLYYCRTGYMGDKYVQADVSVEHKDFPHCPPYNRAEILPGTGWVVEKHKGSEHFTFVSYLVHLDLKLATGILKKMSLTTKVVNRALRQQPMAIADIRDNLQQSMAIPHTSETITIPQQQSQWSKQNVTDKEKRDEEVRVLKEENEELKQQLEMPKKKSMKQESTV